MPIPKITDADVRSLKKQMLVGGNEKFTEAIINRIEANDPGALEVLMGLQAIGLVESRDRCVLIGCCLLYGYLLNAAEREDATKKTEPAPPVYALSHGQFDALCDWANYLIDDPGNTKNRPLAGLGQLIYDVLKSMPARPEQPTVPSFMRPEEADALLVVARMGRKAFQDGMKPGQINKTDYDTYDRSGRAIRVLERVVEESRNG